MEVWPENWRVFVLFSRLQTQWSVGMSGAAGLRYEAVYPLLDRETDTQNEWMELFQDVQVLESAALKQMAENRAET